MNDLFNDNGAILNEDRTHRYSLWRIWDTEKDKVLFIGLNPSRADESYNDPTITRCINFAKSWGYGGMMFLNLYSYRTPSVNELKINIDTAYNEETNSYLREAVKECEMNICAWGSWKFTKQREEQVICLIRKAISISHCLGFNADKSPKHPLYLKQTVKPIIYNI